MTGLMVPPLVIAELLVIKVFLAGWSIPDPIAQLLELAALATLVAGFFVVARYRAALEATKDAADAWRGERDAEFAKSSRLEAEASDLRAKIGVLETRDATAMLAALDAHSSTSTTENAAILKALGSIQKALETER